MNLLRIAARIAVDASPLKVSYVSSDQDKLVVHLTGEIDDIEFDHNLIIGNNYKFSWDPEPGPIPVDSPEWKEFIDTLYKNPRMRMQLELWLTEDPSLKKTGISDIKR